MSGHSETKRISSKNAYTAADKFSYFKLDMGVVIKAEKDWRGVGRPQVAMHWQLPRFLVIYIISLLQCAFVAFL